MAQRGMGDKRLCMENSDYSRRCTEIAGEYYATLDAAVRDTLARMKGKGIVPPCGKGCSWCCHLPVNATAPEGALVAKYIEDKFNVKDKGALIERMSGWLAWYKGGKSASGRAECPFLRDSLCSIYEVRPMGCRVHYSADVEGCRRAMEGVSLFYEPHLLDEVLEAVKPLCMEVRRNLESSGVCFEDCVKPLPELALACLQKGAV